MFGHFKKSASILTDQDTQIVDNDRWPATICNTVFIAAWRLMKRNYLFFNSLYSSLLLRQG